MKTVLFSLLLLTAFSLFTYNIKRIISYIRQSQPDSRFDRLGERIKNVLYIAFGQSKLLREPGAGLIHFFIFWGFNLFLLAVLEAIIQGFSPTFSFVFLGPFFSLITLTQDLFGVLVLISVLAALYRRFILKVKRLDIEGKGKLDAAFVLLMIFMVVFSMFGQNISAVAKHNYVLSEYELRPLSAALSPAIYGSSTSSAEIFYEVFWWIHIVVVFMFMNYLPYSKHLHVITSIPNVFFARLDDQKNILKPINLEDEKLEWFGVDDVEKFSWKQILDGYSCTECGRCTSVCPAANTGKSLSPRKIIVDIRKRSQEKAPLLISGGGEQSLLEKTLVHNYITDKELWQCTTCNACVQECPVMIEHVDAIVDMRRHLVLSESNFPAELNNVFKSLENNYTPWAFDQSARAEWAEGMGIKTMAEDKNTEYLFWVGCAGSYDNRYKKVSRAFAQLMQKAGVDFRILGTEEKCNGDTARRLGNEYLAQQLIKENVEILNGYGVKKIVTACPHCFNSLKKEFPQFGGNYEVIHHTELINSLINQGKLQLKDSAQNVTATYHDSCYIGRYNNNYNAPRESLEAIKGLKLVEMERNRSRGFCCGAGGGRMFLEDVEGGRINEERTREALATKADTIGTACPFCMTMMTDGVKAHQKTEQVSVKDIAEIVLENCT